MAGVYIAQHGRVMYTQGVYTRIPSYGGYSTPWYIYTLCTMAGIVHPGIYTPRYHGGYSTPPCIYHPVHPWVYPYTSCTRCSTGSSGLGVTLPVEEALGSNLEIRLGMKRREPSFSLKCVGWWEPLRRVLPLLPDITDERLDRRRVIPVKTQ